MKKPDCNNCELKFRKLLGGCRPNAENESFNGAKSFCHVYYNNRWYALSHGWLFSDIKKLMRAK